MSILPDHAAIPDEPPRPQLTRFESQPASKPVFAISNSNAVMVAYITLTLAASLFVSQEAVPPVGSALYWLLLLPALTLPLLNLRQILIAAFQWPTILLSFMTAISGVWNLFVGDIHAIPRLVLITVVLIWLSSDAGRIRVSHLVTIYFGTIFLGILVYLLSSLNKWGPFPGLTDPEFGIWRVSVFPNIAYTAFLSLFIVMAMAIRIEFSRLTFPVFVILVVSTFYTITPFVRTATICLVLFAVMRFTIERIRSPRLLFWIPVGVAFVSNAAIALSPLLVYNLQKIPLVSRLLLRGQSNLDIHDIYIQLFRPWVWVQHVHIFLTSPYLMGWGDFDFNKLKSESLIDIIDWSDTVSMPTRLLASHGLPALLFIWFCFAQLAKRARERDKWACACFPSIAMLAMQWGSLLYPADPIFFLFFLILAGGAKAFIPFSAVPFFERPKA